AAGVENLTHYPMSIDIQLGTFIDVEQIHGQFSNQMSELQERMSFVQGESAELVAEKYGLTREDMDKFSLWSHQKATRAMRDKENYEKRVVPIDVSIEQPDGTSETQTVREDQTVRTICQDDPETAWTQISNLKPAFREDGMVTAGNSSQISDGASAVMLMAREKAEELGLKPMVKILSTAVAGDDPTLMLTGPIPAMERALKRAGDLTIEDMDCIEPNEAFAFEYAFEDPRVNPYGGAIAIGHPIGSSGVQYFANMAHFLANKKKKYGIQTLCGGGGVGIATVVERVI
ncbi:MAG: thiolase family protein, partial [Candidatus Hodarchaeales archaeon]